MTNKDKPKGGMEVPTTLAEAFKIAKATRTKSKKVKRDTNN